MWQNVKLFTVINGSYTEHPESSDVFRSTEYAGPFPQRISVDWCTQSACSPLQRTTQKDKSTWTNLDQYMGKYMVRIINCELGCKTRSNQWKRASRHGLRVCNSGGRSCLGQLSQTSGVSLSSHTTPPVGVKRLVMKVSVKGKGGKSTKITYTSKKNIKKKHVW